MKRFFCTICNKIRRARSLPVVMDTPNADKVTDRVGVCNRHTSNFNTSNVIQFHKKAVK